MHVLFYFARFIGLPHSLSLSVEHLIIFIVMFIYDLDAVRHKLTCVFVRTANAFVLILWGRKWAKMLFVSLDNNTTLK